jgi:AraC-like DNA-binding protein
MLSGRATPSRLPEGGANARYKPCARLGALPTASGGIARAAYRLMRQARLGTDAVLAHAHLTAHEMNRVQMRFPVKSQIAFLNAAAQALDRPFLGFELARAIDLRELGLWYYIQASSASLDDAIARAARYSTIHNEGVLLRYTERRNVSVAFRHVGVPRCEDSHQIEFFAVILVRVCRQLTARNLVPQIVKFIHRRPHVGAEVRAFFGCEICFGAETDAVVFPRSAGSLHVVQADPYLNALLARYCDEALATRRAQPGPWRLRVENTLIPLLPHGKANLAQVCTLLGASRRTVIRRLAAEQQTFSAVLDELRQNLAKRYLAEQELPISEIAWLLGYKTGSAFNHAFKRWTRTSPTRARASS